MKNITLGLFLMALAITGCEAPQSPVQTIPIGLTTTEGSAITAVDSSALNSSVGKNGDLNVDSVTNYIWIKANGVWSATSTLVKGSTGLSGLNGTNGTNGINGIGVAGAQGLQGLTGNVGSSGTNGTAGSQGIQGLTGNAGVSGTSGTAGAQGLQGLTGNTGSVGASGTSGVNGTVLTSVDSSSLTALDGNNGDMNIDSVGGYLWKKVAGTWASTGTYIRGLTGATGSQGLTGNTGSVGASGTAGSQGLTGNVGVSGTNGAAGAQGLQGLTGNAGASGSTGLTGPAGPAGPSGTTCLGSNCPNSTTWSGTNAWTGAVFFPPSSIDDYSINNTGRFILNGGAIFSSYVVVNRHLITSQYNCTSPVQPNTDIDFNRANTVCSSVNGGPAGSCTEITLSNVKSQEILTLTGQTVGGCYHVTDASGFRPIYTSGPINTQVGIDTVVTVSFVGDHINLIATHVFLQP